MQETRAKFITIVVAALIAAYIVAPLGKKWPEFIDNAKIRRGIDLAGGAELTYRVLFPNNYKKDRARTSGQVLSVLQKRVNRRGLKEPRLNVQGEDQIVVQLPGVDKDELESFKKLIQTVGKLELKAVADAPTYKLYYDTGEPPSEYEVYANPNPSDRGGDYGYIRDKYLCHEKPVITGDHVANASFDVDIRGSLGGGENYKVDFKLTDEGSVRFDHHAAKLFDQNPKGIIAIIMDGKVISAPVIRARSFGGSGEITGRFSKEQAEDLATVLKSGSLPVPIGRMEGDTPITGEPEAENFVGPTLGQDSIQRGIMALSIAGGAVVVFILVYYLAGGIVAVISLALNLLFLSAIMSLFGATLTLPGIAGIILTVGMAVDANILIFERIREEMAKGKTALQSFEAGHERALSAILDANVTTLIAALVLYWFGTGPVKGFAVTLSIGILTTMFSVLFCGRTFMKLLVTGGSIRQFKMLRLVKDTNITFTRYMRPFFILSVLAVVASFIVFATTDDRKYGLDFKGGTILNFKFREEQNIEDVRNRIQAVVNPETNLPRYSDAEIQILADIESGFGAVTGLGKTTSLQFQFRTSFQNMKLAIEDVRTAFRGLLTHEPFEDLAAEDIPPTGGIFPKGDGRAGGGAWMWLEGENPDIKKVKETIGESIKSLDLLTKDAIDRPFLDLKVVQPAEPVKGLTRVRLLLFEGDTERDVDLVDKVRAHIKGLGAERGIALSTNPFTYEGNIGPAVAEELKNTTIIALIISWVLMIGYIAVRFTSWKFGAAAVVALVHDATITVGVIVLCVVSVPKAWGLSFEMNQTTVAALLTIIGYSVNDTIVTFDRIRENLILRKRDSFPDIVNTSINETLPRTLLTSLTTWITVIILYALTMTSGGGIASFAFPLVLGVVVGTYSSMFIAAPLLVAWFRGRKPVVAK